MLNIKRRNDQLIKALKEIRSLLSEGRFGVTEVAAIILFIDIVLEKERLK